MRSWCWLGVLAACGRVGFDPKTAAPGDGAIDVLGGEVMTIDAPQSLCPTAPGLVCDGFEGQVLAPRWQLDNEQGTSALSTVHAYRGGSSLYVQTDQITVSTPAPRASVISYDALPFTGVLYARVFIYMPAPTDPNFVQLVNFANMAGQGVSMGTENGHVVNNDYSAVLYAESATAFPFDRWACLQMAIPSSTAGTIRVYVDGTEIADAAISTGGNSHPRPSHIYLGIDWPGTYSSLPPSSAWFDELLISDVPISCAD